MTWPRIEGWANDGNGCSWEAIEKPQPFGQVSTWAADKLPEKGRKRALTTVCTKWGKFCNPPGARCYSGNEWSHNPPRMKGVIIITVTRETRETIPDFPRWGCHDRKHIGYIGPFGSTWQQRMRKRSTWITWFCYKQMVCKKWNVKPQHVLGF